MRYLIVTAPTVSIKCLVMEYELLCQAYRHTSYISRTLVGNKIIDQSDVVAASPFGVAPSTSSF